MYVFIINLQSLKLSSVCIDIRILKFSQSWQILIIQSDPPWLIRWNSFLNINSNVYNKLTIIKYVLANGFASSTCSPQRQYIMPMFSLWIKY